MKKWKSVTYLCLALAIVLLIVPMEAQAADGESLPLGMRNVCVHDEDTEYETIWPVEETTVQIATVIDKGLWRRTGSVITGVTLSNAPDASILPVDTELSVFANTNQTETIHFYVQREYFDVSDDTAIIFYGYSGVDTGISDDGKNWFIQQNDRTAPGPDIFTVPEKQLVGWSIFLDNPGSPEDDQRLKMYLPGESLPEGINTFFAVYDDCPQKRIVFTFNNETSGETFYTEVRPVTRMLGPDGFFTALQGNYNQYTGYDKFLGWLGSDSKTYYPGDILTDTMPTEYTAIQRTPQGRYLYLIGFQKGLRNDNVYQGKTAGGAGYTLAHGLKAGEEMSIGSLHNPVFSNPDKGLVQYGWYDILNHRTLPLHEHDRTITIPEEGGVVLMAIYGFEVNYHWNYDGAPAPKYEVYEIGTKYNSNSIAMSELTLGSHARYGYKFIGWNTERDGSGTYITDGTIYDQTHHDLFAQWEKLGTDSRAWINFHENSSDTGVLKVVNEYSTVWSSDLLNLSPYKSDDFRTLVGFVDDTGKVYSLDTDAFEIAKEGQVIDLTALWESNITITTRGILFANYEKIIDNAYKKATGKFWDYVVFTLPDKKLGTLYSSVNVDNKWGIITDAVLLNSGEKLYASQSDGTPLKDVAFIPAEGVLGPVTLCYTAYDFEGNNAYNGELQFVVKLAESIIYTEDNIRAVEGETLEIPVMINYNNPGFAGLNFTHTFDSDVLTLKEVVPHAMLGLDKGTFIHNGNLVTWFNSDNATRMQGGILYTLVFEVNEDAPEGSYTLSTALTDGLDTNFTDENGRILPVWFQPSTISIVAPVPGDLSGDGELAVQDAVILAKSLVNEIELTTSQKSAADLDGDGVVTAADALILARRLVGLPDTQAAMVFSRDAIATVSQPLAALEVGRVAAKHGETVTVPVYIKENTGVASFALEINYDTSVLKLQDIAEGDVLVSAGGTFTKNVDAATVVWTSVDGVSEDGQLFNLAFRVLDDAQIGNTPITVVPKDNHPLNIVDDQVNPVDLNLANGGITVLRDGFSLIPPIFSPVVEEDTSISFDDICKNDWFYDEVMDVVDKGLMTGTGQNKFSPQLATSRAMIVTTLWRMEGEPMGVEESNFSDVVKNSWYGYAVDWASAFGIVEGYDGKFAPNGAITREQFAAILYRYAKYKGYDVWSCQTDLNSFTDVASVSDYAVEPMQWAVGAGLMEGTNFQMMPQGTATRAQAAAILSRFLG